MELAIVLWIMCGITTGIIASAKGMHAGLWVIIGIALGVFGLIIVCAIPRKDTK